MRKHIYQRNRRLERIVAKIRDNNNDIIGMNKKSTVIRNGFNALINVNHIVKLCINMYILGILAYVNH